MIPVLSRGEMRAFDARAIGEASVPGVVLMENAGRGAADVIERELFAGNARGRHAVVVCGTGNNGGDGFVVARHLRVRGGHVQAFLVGPAARITGDAGTQRAAWIGCGGALVEIAGADGLAALREALRDACIAVDAIFGTGLDRPTRDLAADVIAVLNDASTRRVALDVPSGMHADTGHAMGATVVAELTVTFGHLKLGLVTPHGAERAGRVVTTDIGVPPMPAVARAGAPSVHLLEGRDVAAWLRPRGAGSHKGSAGHVGVLAGSPGKVGAALLVARGALRGGAGVATIASRAEAVRALEQQVLEVMTTTLDPADAKASVAAAIAGKRALVVGPGFGTDDAAGAFVAHVVDAFNGPAVFDADALTLFSGRPEALAAARGRLILTPHPGEAGRLLGYSAAVIEADRFAAARELAARARAVVVLKGSHSLVAEPGGRVVVSCSGSPALATAGSGDVLGGVIAAQLCAHAQALEPFEAACAGVYLHGAAGAAWSALHADRGLLAHEIADQVPGVIASLLRSIR